jgi:Fe2+ or Zn2+ uptake regulation protein
MERHAQVAAPCRAADDDLSALTVLRSAGLTPTGPRRAVYQVLVGQERPVGAAEIYQLLRGAGPQPGLTSVYRVLCALAAVGTVHAFPGDEQRYRICQPAPHGHLVCESCGRVIEHPVAGMRRWLASMTREAGFAPTVEHMDVYGICERCQSDENGDDAPGNT